MRKFKCFLLILVLIVPLFLIRVFAQNEVNISANYDSTGASPITLSALPQYSNSQINLQWTASTNTDHYKIQISSTSSFLTIEDTLTTTQTNYTYISVYSGPTFFRVIPVNSQNVDGNSSNVVSTTIDLSPPNTKITNAVFNNTNNITINYTNTDDFSGVKNVYLYVQENNNSWINYIDMGTSGNYIFSPVDNGATYNFLAIGVDSVGNIESKPFTPEFSLNIPVVTPTNTPTPSSTNTLPSITISPTNPIATPQPIKSPPVTPIPPISNSEYIIKNINIYTFPQAEVIIFADNNVISDSYSDNSGLYSANISVSKYISKINIEIKSKDKISIFRDSFTLNDKINYLTPPIFSTYYINTPAENNIKISGYAYPNSNINIYKNNNELVATAVAQSDGGFTTTLPNNNFDYSVKANTEYNDYKSDYSNILLVKIISSSKKIIIPKDSNFINIFDIPLLNYFINDPSKISLIQNIFYNIETLCYLLLLPPTIFVAYKFITEGAFIPLSLYSKRKLQRGKVYDSITKQGIPFAKVSIFDQDNNKLIYRTFTDNEGNFPQKNMVHAREYYMHIQHPQYEENEDVDMRQIEESIINTYIGGSFIYRNNIYVCPLQERKEKAENNIAIDLLKLIARFKGNYFIFIFLLNFLFVSLTYNKIYLFSLLFFLILYIYSERNNYSYKTIGKVLDKETNDGVEDVKLVLFKNNSQMSNIAISNNNGEFDIKSLKGEYALNVIKDGYLLVQTKENKIDSNSKILYTVSTNSSKLSIYLYKKAQ